LRSMMVGIRPSTGSVGFPGFASTQCRPPI
jgi:hypothetical protein